MNRWRMRSLREGIGVWHQRCCKQVVCTGQTTERSSMGLLSAALSGAPIPSVIIRPQRFGEDVEWEVQLRWTNRHTRWLRKRNRPNEGVLSGAWTADLLLILSVLFKMPLDCCQRWCGTLEHKKGATIAARGLHDCISTRRHTRIT